MDGLTVGYARVSTASGEQLSALRVQITRLEAEGCDLILQDVESGRNPLREQYQQLRRLIEACRVTEVVATALTRLGRDAAESDAFVRLCDQRGVRCRSLAEGLLTMETPEDLLLTRLRGSLSQGESMRISQRVVAGLEQGRKMGKPMRKPCWGYRLRADRMAFEPDPEQFPQAQELIRVLKANGWRLITTLRQYPELAPFRSCRGLRAWLMNPTIRGGVGYHQIKNHQFTEVLWDRHPALITHAEFGEFQRALELNRRHWGVNTTAKPRMLTSLCVCAECGCRLCYIPDRRIPGLRCKGDGCSQLYRSTREEVIVRFIIDQLALGAAEKLAASVEQRESAEVVELRQQIKRLEALHDAELMPVIEAKRIRLESLLRQPGTDPELLRKVADRRWFDLATSEELRELFQQLVETVTITRQVPTAIRLRL